MKNVSENIASVNIIFFKNLFFSGTLVTILRTPGQETKLEQLVFIDIAFFIIVITFLLFVILVFPS